MFPCAGCPACCQLHHTRCGPKTHPPPPTPTKQLKSAKIIVYARETYRRRDFNTHTLYTHTYVHTYTHIVLRGGGGSAEVSLQGDLHHIRKEKEKSFQPLQLDFGKFLRRQEYLDAISRVLVVHIRQSRRCVITANCGQGYNVQE